MNQLTIVMYHYVRELRASRYPEVKGLDFSLFLEQIHYLKGHYHFVRAEEVIAALNGQHPLPPRAVLLTFDDAYIDHYTYVFPVLDQMGIQGSFYVPVKAITEHEILDVNKIHFILASSPDKTRLFKQLQSKVIHARTHHGLKPIEQYLQAYAQASRHDTAEVMFIKNMLQFALPEALRAEIADQLFVETVGIDQSAFSRELYMNTAQIETMRRHGMHIGCHGYNHLWWDKLDASALQREIELSFGFLDQIGVPQHERTACYPYGAHSDLARTFLQNMACQYALTTEVALAHVCPQKRYVLPRLDTNDLPKDRHATIDDWRDLIKL